MQLPTQSQASRGLETRTIVYADRRRPHTGHREIRVDVRCGEVIDDDYAAATVAARTTLGFTDVFVVKVTG